MSGRADLVLFDGRLVEPAAARLSAFDRGVLYGESLFETLKVVEGAPCFWERHGGRLAGGCAELGLPVDLDAVEAGVRALLDARPVARGALRIQVTGGEQPGGGRGLTAPAAGRRPHVVATVVPVPAPSAAFYADGADVLTASDLCRPLPHLKSGSYLASVAAKARAEREGAFECLFVTGSPPVLVEGSFTSVCASDEDGLVVPPAAGRLPGVTVGVVAEEATRLGLSVRSGVLEVGWLTGASRTGSAAGTGATPAVLLASSLLGVCDCARIDGLPVRRDPERAATLRNALEAREARSRRAWMDLAGEEG